LLTEHKDPGTGSGTKGSTNEGGGKKEKIFVNYFTVGGEGCWEGV